jgi:hypothetical protein
MPLWVVNLGISRSLFLSLRIGWLRSGRDTWWLFDDALILYQTLAVLHTPQSVFMAWLETEPPAVC